MSCAHVGENWFTPHDFFEVVEREVGPFTLDAAAAVGNAKCATYFTSETNGLAHSWAGHSVWVNPPYTRNILPWVKKAYDESRDARTRVALLIFANTDTRYWHDYVMKAADVYFVRGRLKFGGVSSHAPKPSVLIVFRPDSNGPPRMHTLDWKAAATAAGV